MTNKTTIINGQEVPLLVIDGEEVPVLSAKSVEIIKNKSTGQIYDSITEFNADVANPNTPTKIEDLQRDVQITVASLQVFGKTKE
jgi:hypothetical protein